MAGRTKRELETENAARQTRMRAVARAVARERKRQGSPVTMRVPAVVGARG